MKLIHFADIHLGVETYGKIDPASGLSSRFMDFLGAFDQLVDYAIKENVDLVLFGGDAYKSRDPSQTQQREFAKRIKRLSQCGIPVFLLVGNHDLPGAMGRATSTEIFDTLAVDGVYVASRPNICRINTKSGPVQVVSLPWLKRGNVIARDEAKNLDLQDVNQRLREILAGIIANMVAKLDPTIPAVLVAHVWVHGAKLGSEEGMTIGTEHTLLLSAIANPAFDYVALGHIHRQQVLSDDPPVVYAGSLERLDFGDEGLEKGFYVADIVSKDGKRKTAFHLQSIVGRRFLTLTKTLDIDDPDPTDTVITLLNQRAEELNGSIVRLELTLPQVLQGQVREAAIRAAAATAHYFAITYKIERIARVRLAGVSVAHLTPQHALETYLKMKLNDAPARLEELLTSGRELIQEEGLKTK
ncbi:MAG: exonuclease SbcCD subunit D [Dehalococcoidia bacterium]|nr:exonuclease SbcCD subunit D [Dehalococcoidia bacterium]